MADGFIIINKKEWEEIPEEQRWNMMFSTLQTIDIRLQKLEKKRFIDKACSFGGGIVGGLLAVFGIKYGIKV